MKIAIIGAGAAGLFLARALEGKGHSLTLFDHKEQAGKKLMATGNGRCNLLNTNLSSSFYSNKEFAETLFREYTYQELKRVVEEEWLCPLMEIGDYVYPASLSGIAFGHYLKASIHANFVFSSKIGDYAIKEDGVHLFHDAKEEVFDELVFATGGMSTPKFGSDGSIFPLLQKHGYAIKPLEAGLTPIKVKETNGLKGISGVRLKALCEVYVSNKKVYEENGEVLFRKDGLSGIVIFNTESILVHLGAKEAKIVLRPIPSFQKDRAIALMKWKEIAPTAYLESLFVPSFANYLLERSREEKVPLSSLLNEISFTYIGHSSFEDSTISIGGVPLGEIEDDFSSKREKSVHFLGEILDFDGLCGGYNLSFCLASALKKAKSWIKD